MGIYPLIWERHRRRLYRSPKVRPKNLGSIIYSVDGNKNAFKVVRLRELMLLSALFFGSMSNNVGDNLNQQNLLNYAAASIAN